MVIMITVVLGTSSPNKTKAHTHVPDSNDKFWQLTFKMFTVLSVNCPKQAPFNF